METSTEAAAAVVDALGSAWSVHALYPDPENQPAFMRSVQAVAEAAGSAFSVAVVPSGFVYEGEPLETHRGSADRLAKRLFVHNVDALDISGAPSEREVIVLFELLSRHESDVTASGGVGAALARAGVQSFAVTDRAPLAEGLVEEQTDRAEPVEAVLASGSDPETFAREMTELGGGEPSRVAELILERYVEVMGLIDESDVGGGEAVVQAFVEAFFHLDSDIQKAVLETYLRRFEDPVVRPFLDQFASHELIQFAPDLDPQGMSLLMNYARIVTDPEADGRSQDLLTLLEAPERLASARQAIAGHLEDRFGAFDDVPQDVDVDLPDPRRYFFTVLDVFRDLLDVEERPDRFRRVLRVWSGKVKSAIRRGELRRVELWIRALQDNPTYADGWSEDVTRALETTVSSELIEQLMDYYVAEETSAAALRVLSVAGEVAMRPLIALLADADATDRRPIVEVLTDMAPRHPQPILDAIEGAPWYLERNLAIVLRKGNVPEAVATMKKLIHHEDARVRIEAVRGLAVLGGPDDLEMIADAIGDEDDSVRSTALTALGTSPHPGAEEILVESISSAKLTPAQRTRAIELVGRQPTEETRALLERLASRKIALTGTARQLRSAARKALEVQ